MSGGGSFTSDQGSAHATVGNSTNGSTSIEERGLHLFKQKVMQVVQLFLRSGGASPGTTQLQLTYLVLKV